MSNKMDNLTSILELPGLSNLVKAYNNCSLNVDNRFVNRKQFLSIDHESTINVFSYGDLVLNSPSYMFIDSMILTFTSKGSVSLIENTSYMFSGASYFNSDLSRWNVSNVTDMSGMFWKAVSFSSDLSRWNVQNVTDMYRMFQSAISFDSDLSKWNVEKVKDMQGMFSFVKIFNSDLSRWSFSNVTNIISMFYCATSFESDLSRWNCEKLNLTKLSPLK